MHLGRPAFGSASKVGQNFTHIGTGPAEIDSGAQLAYLRAWTETELERHRDLIEVRKRHGRVRHCHGDLHLTNMVSMHGEIVVFDGIEFNAALSCIDVMSEIAFLLMDLDVRERPDLGSIFLDRYLEESGDYEGLYRVYRSLVRAKRLSRASIHAACAGPAAWDGHDASEANLAVLDHQVRGQEPLTPHEQALTLHWDTECPGEAARVAAEIERLTPRRPTR